MIDVYTTRHFLPSFLITRDKWTHQSRGRARLPSLAIQRVIYRGVSVYLFILCIRIYMCVCVFPPHTHFLGQVQLSRIIFQKIFSSVCKKRSSLRLPRFLLNGLRTFSESERRKDCSCEMRGWGRGFQRVPACSKHLRGCQSF